MMKESIVKFAKSKNVKKKYTATLQNKITKEVRKLSFGASGYQQYKDRTGLRLYEHKDHMDTKRRQNYFKRHSGIPLKSKAIEEEKRKSNGFYTPKILSHMYLW